MPCFVAVCQLHGHRSARRLWAALALGLLLATLCLATVPAQAQGVEVLELKAGRDEAAVSIDYQLRVSLPPAVEAAVLRGVPVYFTAQATLWRPRWYWRDERVARATRSSRQYQRGRQSDAWAAK